MHSVDDEGGVIEKDVLPNTLHALIGKALASMDGGWKETPWLPNHCIRYAIANGMQKVLIYVPATRRDIWLYDQKIEKLPFPDIVFGFVINGTAVYKKYVVVIKESFIQPDTPLYRYPYSNVHGDGQACWSDTPAIEDIWQINGLPNIFFTCPDNGDLYFGGVNKVSDKPYRQFVESMKGKEFFPKELLMPRNETLADLWKRM